ncbi:MAG: c-type cytochrome [Pirellulales bacterium]|nr:c-type cytochrome [Pirellulales bacterium]
MENRTVMVVVLATVLGGSPLVRAADRAPELVPHNQDAAPGPALSPAEAAARMTVPEGFKVEVVAAEPDLINPTSMTFDERGRIWVTESVEYPRSSPGEGRDRVKVLEDTDHDGRVDQTTIFAEGLNIPSGIAVGYGGVWVANSPDILLLRDQDGDLRADAREVVLTGFGRSDTHELPNSLTWGPDGWLYGLNGVFNHSRVVHQGVEHKFNCAMWRLHPRTRRFELFAEGTSNPWGIAWDTRGSAFVSACVIDHLWHLVETGYYHRQAGAYPPYTWEIQSIVDHAHQKAAYCGLHFFDSDAYPEAYRERLYMGNIHGGCINVDRLVDRGATYRASAEPDFLTAHDAWFMPIVQKTGPDGCLYILDWYDRYHCYQDARRDPDGLDRGRGRLYRVRYQDVPRASAFDLAVETDEQLIGRLANPNVFYRDLAQRLLAERGDAATALRLESLVFDETQPRKTRMHALFARVSMGPLSDAFYLGLLAHADADLCAWGVRAAGNQAAVSPAVAAQVATLAKDDRPGVQLQVAIAARKVSGLSVDDVLWNVLQHAQTEEVLLAVVWGQLQPRLVERVDEIARRLQQEPVRHSRGVGDLTGRVVDRLARAQVAPASLVDVLKPLLGDPFVEGPAQHALFAMRMLEPPTDSTAAWHKELRGRLSQELNALIDREPTSMLTREATWLSASWGDRRSLGMTQDIVADAGQDVAVRLEALAALAAGDTALARDTGLALLDSTDKNLVRGVLARLGGLNDPALAAKVLAVYAQLSPDVQPAAIELLTQRADRALELLEAIATGTVPSQSLSSTQVRRLLIFDNRQLSELIAAHWGTVRPGRDPAREQVLVSMRRLMENASGNVERGATVYRKLCAQCHKFRGEGQEVGPDLTSNGRGSFDQLLSNVFDPSLVIGAAYQARTVITTDGRAITGLAVEDNPQRVVLKLQGGKLESIAREEVEQVEISPLSLMPEGIEKQLSEQEVVDLFTFLLEDAGGLP